MTTAPPPGRPTVRRRVTAGLGRNVCALGAASLCTDLASEMIAPVRIVFLVLVLGAPLPIAGLLEGLAEGSAGLLKVVSGRLADRVPRRGPLILAGYALSAVAKPLLALAAGWPHVLTVMLLDRAGKGLRSSPRDALLADSAPPGYRGKVFGFHRSMDTLGAAIGPAAALAILARSPQDLRAPPGCLDR